MYRGNYSFNHQSAANQYLIRDILDASPQKLLIKVYDFALVNIQKHDFVKTNNALQVLIDALRFDDEKAKEVSVGLLKLYKFCQDQMRLKNYEIVYKIISELKTSWVEAFHNNNIAI